MVDYEDPFAGIATIRTYETDSEGNPSMLKQFYETQKDVMDGARTNLIYLRNRTGRNRHLPCPELFLPGRR